MDKKHSVRLYKDERQKVLKICCSQSSLWSRHLIDWWCSAPEIPHLAASSKGDQSAGTAIRMCRWASEGWGSGFLCCISSALLRRSLICPCICTLLVFIRRMMAQENVEDILKQTHTQREPVTQSEVMTTDIFWQRHEKWITKIFCNNGKVRSEERREEQERRCWIVWQHDIKKHLYQKWLPVEQKPANMVWTIKIMVFWPKIRNKKIKDALFGTYGHDTSLVSWDWKQCWSLASLTTA